MLGRYMETLANSSGRTAKAPHPQVTNPIFPISPCLNRIKHCVKHFSSEHFLFVNLVTKQANYAVTPCILALTSPFSVPLFVCL